MPPLKPHLIASTAVQRDSTAIGGYHSLRRKFAMTHGSHASPTPSQCNARDDT